MPKYTVIATRELRGCQQVSFPVEAPTREEAIRQAQTIILRDLQGPIDAGTPFDRLGWQEHRRPPGAASLILHETDGDNRDPDGGFSPAEAIAYGAEIARKVEKESKR